VDSVAGLAFGIAQGLTLGMAMPSVEGRSAGFRTGHGLGQMLVGAGALVSACLEGLSGGALTLTGVGAPVAVGIEAVAVVQGAAGVAAVASGVAVLMGDGGSWQVTIESWL
jgi:hypothetical protein